MSVFAFYFFALVTLACGVVVVGAKNIVRSVTALFIALVAVAGLYFHMSAAFIGAMQLTIYAGGITVLLIFAIMLVRRITGEQVEQQTRQPIPALVVGLGFAVWVSSVVWVAFDPAVNRAMSGLSAPREASIKDVAFELVYRYLPAFEIASVLLLVAMVGAIALTLRAKHREGPEEEGVEYEYVGDRPQVRITPEGVDDE